MMDAQVKGISAVGEADRQDAAGGTGNDGVSLIELLVPLAEHVRLLTLAPLATGLLAFGVTSLIAPTFTATTTFLPPQQQQSSAAAAMASLGALANLAGVSGSLRTPADQYVSIMQSATVSDRIVDEFKLMEVYKTEYRIDARRVLLQHVRFVVGKKDGLISIEADDKNPQRAADIANAYIDELRRMTDTLAVSEAQQRRVFFENQLRQTQQKLVQAQQALQASGLTQGTLKAEPRSAAEGYARLKAELTAAEVRLQTLRSSLAETSVEVQQQQMAVSALRSQLAKLEQTTEVQGGPDYVSKYREFKYQETLFDLMARQYELARVDESREGALIQVVDKATPPERKSSPKKAVAAIVTTLVTGIALAVFVMLRWSWRQAAQDPANAAHVARLREGLRRRRRE